MVAENRTAASNAATAGVAGALGGSLDNAWLAAPLDPADSLSEETMPGSI